MGHEQIAITTRDGECQAHLFTPEGKGEGPWPAAIFYMDAFAIRPTLFEMAARLADNGYVVLLPDLFYRHGHYDTLVPREVFAQNTFGTVIAPLMASTDTLKAVADTAAFVAYLDSRDDVAGPIGTIGLCMGGGLAIAAAGAFPDRIAAAASFHGGNLYTDQPTSAHLFLPKVEGELYVAAADQDHSYPPEMAEKFEAALRDSGVVYRHETYAGAAHGWMKPDLPVYDEAAAERGWAEMLALFDRKLKA
ncbi:dienelactone hydrolase family protein [uncultured Sphingomonas sp.]|uniref:dienelactone hydrolase family protein n=1 Tax=uncultured Sphingomonas sp. TaxID=158754 RepID=UPI002602FF08|nr:dienelactone hydrolase family protein [uncultured Sphingomonas sp.]